MTDRARKALLKSIEHWHQNLDLLILNHLSGCDSLLFDLNFDGDGCALCSMFYRGGGCCRGCPVARRSGANDCHNTPYYNVRRWSRDEEEPSYEYGYRVITAELEFLYSLLEGV